MEILTAVCYEDIIPHQKSMKYQKLCVFFIDKWTNFEQIQLPNFFVEWIRILLRYGLGTWYNKYVLK